MYKQKNLIFYNFISVKRDEIKNEESEIKSKNHITE